MLWAKYCGKCSVGQLPPMTGASRLQRRLICLKPFPTPHVQLRAKHWSSCCALMLTLPYTPSSWLARSLSGNDLDVGC